VEQFFKEIYEHKTNALIFRAFTLLPFILLLSCCNKTTDNSNKLDNIKNNKVIQTCLTTDNGIDLSNFGTFANNEKYFYAIPSLSSPLRNNICKIKINATDDYRFFLNQGQGPGEINNTLNKIFYCPPNFIISDLGTKKLKLFDKNFNYIDFIFGISEPEDLIIDFENGKFLATFPCYFIPTIENTKSIWSASDKILDNIIAIGQYKITDNRAKPIKIFLTYRQIKNFCKKNEFDLSKIPKSALTKIKLLNNEIAIIYGEYYPFFIIVNFCKNKWKKVDHVMVNNYKKYKDFFTIYNISFSNKFIYTLEFVQSNNFSRYAIHKYSHEGKYLLTLDCVGERENIRTVLPSGPFAITHNDKIILSETLFFNNHRKQTEQHTIIIDVPAIIKNKGSKLIKILSLKY